MLVRRALPIGLLLLVATQVRGAPVAAPATPEVAARFAAVASWPASTSLLVSEVVTGGASASDEYVEIYNASSAPADLGGLELVYATASGSTVSRKQTWTSLTLGGHRHLLI